jgi:hypothetical protein
MEPVMPGFRDTETAQLRDWYYSLRVFGLGWVRHVARMRATEMRTAFWWGKFEGYLGIDRRKILKYALEK